MVTEESSGAGHASGRRVAAGRWTTTWAAVARDVVSDDAWIVALFIIALLTLLVGWVDYAREDADSSSDGPAALPPVVPPHAAEADAPRLDREDVRSPPWTVLVAATSLVALVVGYVVLVRGGVGEELSVTHEGVCIRGRRRALHIPFGDLQSVDISNDRATLTLVGHGARARLRPNKYWPLPCEDEWIAAVEMFAVYVAAALARTLAQDDQAKVQAGEVSRWSGEEAWTLSRHMLVIDAIGSSPKATRLANIESCEPHARESGILKTFRMWIQGARHDFPTSGPNRLPLLFLVRSLVRCRGVHEARRDLEQEAERRRPAEGSDTRQP